MLHETLVAPFALQLRCCVRGNLPQRRMFYKVILHLVITSVFKMRLINRSISSPTFDSGRDSIRRCTKGMTKQTMYCQGLSLMKVARQITHTMMKGLCFDEGVC